MRRTEIAQHDDPERLKFASFTRIVKLMTWPRSTRLRPGCSKQPSMRRPNRSTWGLKIMAARCAAWNLLSFFDIMTFEFLTLDGEPLQWCRCCAATSGASAAGRLPMCGRLIWWLCRKVRIFYLRVRSGIFGRNY